MVKGVQYYPEISWASDDRYWCLYKNTAIKNDRVNGTFFDFSSSDTLNYCLENCGKLIGAACHANDPEQIGDTSTYRNSIKNNFVNFIRLEIIKNIE